MFDNEVWRAVFSTDEIDVLVVLMDEMGEGI